MRNQFIKTIEYLAENDDKVILLTADLGYKIFDNFSKKHENRFINVGIAEANMIGLAAGLALEGFKPYVYSIIPFATMRCFEQIRNDIVYNNLNVKIVGVGSGYCYGSAGHTHHGLEDIAILRTLPNIVITSPGDALETDMATKLLHSHEGPGYLRLGRCPKENINKKEINNIKLGQTIEIYSGDDICIFCTGDILENCSIAHEMLKQDNINCSLVSVPTLKPLKKEEIIKHTKDKKLIISVEEHTEIGGLSSIISESIVESESFIKFKKIAIPDTINKSIGEQEYLRDSCGLSPEKIYNTVKVLNK